MPNQRSRKRFEHGSLILLAVLSILTAAVSLAGTSLRTSVKESTRPEGPFVRIIGSVQDGGMPHAACEHPLCLTARDDPEKRLRVASIALIDPASKEVYLFDATPDIREQLGSLSDVRGAPIGRVDRSPLAGIFLTHAHIGHYLGLSFFGFEAINSKALPVYATPRMSSYLRANGPWSQLVSMKNIDLREVIPGEVVSILPTVTVEPIAVPHRDELSDTVGYLLRGPKATLFYVPDTDGWDAWSKPIEDYVKEADLVLLDGTFFSGNEIPGRPVAEIGHPLITESMRRLQHLAREPGKKIFFTHLNHSNPALVPTSKERRLIQDRGFEIAIEGLEFAL